LDNTLWKGILLENETPVISEEIRFIVLELDARGILQSIASKNDTEAALAVLEREGLIDYFLHPQIHWNPKSTSIRTIAKKLNIAVDSIGFIDDQAFEREEVQYEIPQIRTYDVTQSQNLLKLPEFSPLVVSDDARFRRLRYLENEQREAEALAFEGTNDDFLRSLKMQLTIKSAVEQDLDRIEELTLRTNQLNTTGISFSKNELRELLYSTDHKLWIASLSDKFGEYGNIGVILAEVNNERLKIRLFLLSCRVMNRGIGPAVISFLKTYANSQHLELWADFKETNRNRIMYLTYKLAGFEEVQNLGEMLMLKCNPGNHSSIPDYVDLEI